jgi:CMP/dCMP kinase
MNIPDIIIAVDGYSSTGKSSFAKMVASEFSFLYLDSGALYRCVTLFAQENGFIDGAGHIDEEGLRDAVRGLDLRFRSVEGESKAFIGDRCVESEIRTMAVSSQVSPVSALPFVREFVDEILHRAGADGRVIMDGRDIGTTVFPEAQLKIFMTASVEVRAQRRYAEMKAKGSETTLEEVVKNLRDRDYMDAHREVSPLVRAEDAFIMDNSDMTIHEELVWLKGLIQGKFGILEQI